jgi:hypothetical protein
MTVSTAGFYHFVHDLTITNCEFSASDQSGSSIAALVGNGMLGGTLTITGTEFKTIFRGQVLRNTATSSDVSRAKLKKVVFNSNTMTTVEGSLSFNGVATMPITTCEF